MYLASAETRIDDGRRTAVLETRVFPAYAPHAVPVTFPNDTLLLGGRGGGGSARGRAAVPKLNSAVASSVR